MPVAVDDPVSQIVRDVLQEEDVHILKVVLLSYRV